MQPKWIALFTLQGIATSYILYHRVQDINNKQEEQNVRSRGSN